ncbi:mannosyl-oligosaccharide 1,2-alpha-mannosidase [Aureococcus anophagefferens]|nr:mannosyl-oligosaccharide 1,2-alpha-mannosidase [Aureococcus anophagefferens]
MPGSPASAGRAILPPLGASDAAQRVRASIASAFARYRAEAWGADVLAPLSQSGRDRYASGTLGVTLVASLDALWAARLDDDLEAAAAWVAASRPARRLRLARRVDVGEASGRVLGGLLSAFAATGDVRLLRAARQLGDRLLPAWAAAAAPVGRLWSAKLGVAAPPGDLGVGTTLDAVAGLAELRELARVTGGRRFRDAADDHLAAVLGFRAGSGDALASDRVSVTAGSFLAANLTLSLFFLRRATGDAAYAARAWDLFAHFEKGAATRGAFAALGDAEADPAAESPRRLVDDMPPSVIAATLKFLYLTFLENETGATHWPAGDAFAVTPRGHALPVASGPSLPPTDDDAAGAALRVGRVGTLTIPDDVDAADAIETFAAAARDAGHDVFRAKEMAGPTRSSLRAARRAGRSPSP